MEFHNRWISKTCMSPLHQPKASALETTQDSTMEDGSLLNEALKRNVNTNHNTLLVDVYLLAKDEDSERKGGESAFIDLLLALAETCVHLNEYIRRQSTEYPWLQGGDGPVFGIHALSSTCDESIGSSNVLHQQQTLESMPHLRAQCRYSASVADEWTLIGLVLRYSELVANTSSLRKDLVVECSDVDDGQILLIQAAEYLPSWVDHIGSEFCQHRCWIQRGEVHLIEPDQVALMKHPHGKPNLSLSLKEALRSLREDSTSSMPHTGITRCIRETVDKNNQTCHVHKAAIAVPLPLMNLLCRRPDLTAIICEAFASHCHDPVPKSRMDLASEQEWIWTTHLFGRTAYAMLRSIVAPPDWKTEMAIPKRYQSPQVKRLQRQCQNQSTPHLHHGLHLGVRLVAGLDALLQCDKDNDNGKQFKSSATELRVTELWPAIARQCHGGGDDWIRQAWNDGPNHSEFDLSFLMKCPVYEMEVEGAETPLSRPGISLQTQIRQELLRKEERKLGSNWTIPAPEDVDNEEWMTLPINEEMKKFLGLPAKLDGAEANQANSGGSGFQSMLEGVHTFMDGRSSYEGVSYSTNEDEKADHKASGCTFSPRVFLNFLHCTLEARSGAEVEEMFLRNWVGGGDDYFSYHDYDLVLEGSDDEGDGPDAATVEMMEAMDQELGDKQSRSRAKDNIGISTTRQSNSLNVEEGKVGDDIGEDVHLLTNLMKSLESSNGDPGPINSIMNQLDKDAPMLLPLGISGDSTEIEDNIE